MKDENMKPQFENFQELQDFYGCPRCSQPLTQVWENNGFVPPNGPEKMEFSHYSCKFCGGKWSHKDLEDALEKRRQEFIDEKKAMAMDIN